ncbi:MAG: hypothetical protein KAW39_09790 [Thermoplasmata archaeon]|nr:hypothetical protein [Thermoplasmata archaeon]
MASKRRKNLMELAKKILEDMEDHQLFGFILSHVGKKAVPEIVKLWGEPATPETAVKAEENMIELVKRV